MSDVRVERRRTGWDIVFGALLVVGGLVILGNAAFASVVTVRFLGWMLLSAGLVGLVGSLFRIGKGGFWSAALGGALLGVLGLVFLRHTGATLVTLTLVAGSLFLASGIVRIVAAVQDAEYRWPLLFAGIVSTLLGLMVVLNLVTMSLMLLGVMLGVQALVDGLTMMMVGRLHFGTRPAGTGRMAVA